MGEIEKIPSVNELRKLCEKKNWRVSWRVKFLWFFSAYLSKLFLHLKITSIQINLLMTLFGLAGIAFFIVGGYLYNLIGVFLISIGILLDTVDGDINRFKKIDPLRSGYLDLMSHIIVFPLIPVGIAVGTFINNPTRIPDHFFLVAGFVSSYFLMLINFTKLKKYEHFLKKEDFETLRSIGPKKVMINEARKRNFFAQEMKHLFNFGHVFNLLFFFALFNVLSYLVFLYAIVTAMIFIRRFYYNTKRIRKIF